MPMLTFISYFLENRTLPLAMPGSNFDSIYKQQILTISFFFFLGQGILTISRNVTMYTWPKNVEKGKEVKVKASQNGCFMIKSLWDVLNLHCIQIIEGKLQQQRLVIICKVTCQALA